MTSIRLHSHLSLSDGPGEAVADATTNRAKMEKYFILNIKSSTDNVERIGEWVDDDRERAGDLPPLIYLHIATCRDCRESGSS